jgi:hypothetical protein
MSALPRPSLDGPRRRGALPLAVFTCPPLFLSYREATTCGSAAGCSAGAMAGYALLALLGLPAAVLLARRVADGRAPWWFAPRPDDGTLAVLVAIVVAVDGYLLLAATGVVPTVLDRVAAPLGILVGLPLVVVQVVLFAVGNALGEPPMALQFVAVAVGVALSAVWWYVLAAGMARAATAAGRFAAAAE